MAATKKTFELDTRIESIVREEYADFEKYLPTPQDKAMYRRKQTDFGMLQYLTDRFMPNDIVYGLSPEYIKKAFLRNFKTGDIPKINDMGRRMVNGEWTLEMRAEKAHFKIEDLDGVVPTL